MKNIYLTQMLQGCSKRNGMTVRASNPDGEPTVNRQSRLMSLSGKKAEKEQLSPTCLLSASFPLSFRSRYLRYAAMIFCVLAMNVGQMWATPTTISANFKCAGSPLSIVSTPSGGDGTYFSAITASSSGGTLQANNDTLRINVDKSSSATLTYTFTAKQAITVSGYKIYGTASSDKIQNATVAYTGNLSGDAKTFTKGAKNLKVTYVEKTGFSTDVAKDGAFQIIISLSNTDAKTARNFRMFKIELEVEASAAAGSNYCMSVFNSSNNQMYTGFTQVGSTSEYILEDFTVPGKDGSSRWPQFWIGENSAWSGTYSANANFADMNLVPGTSCTLGLAEGAVGTIHIWDDNKASGSNLWAKFEPSGYGMSWGPDGGDWSDLAFTVDESDNTVWWTDMQTLTAAQKSSWKYWVGLAKSSGYVYSGVDNEASDSRGVSRTKNMSAMKVRETSSTFKETTLSSEATGQHGKFRIWVNNSEDYNFYCHFVPFYVLSYDPNGGTGSTADTERSIEESASVSVASNGFIAPTGYHFAGWATSDARADAGTVDYAPEDDYTLSADATLYAVWEINTYTVSFESNNGDYGTVDESSIASVPYGSEVSIAANVLTLNGTDVTATAASSTAAYTYAFSSWSVSDGAEITEAQTITATFTRTANQYSVSITPTNVTKLTGSTGANAATYGTNYTATFRRNVGYNLPTTVTVTRGGATDITANCTWNSSTGTLTIPGAQLTGTIAITVSGTAVTCPDGSSTETLYSAEVAATSDQSFAASTSDQLLTSSQATVSGGFMRVSNGESSSKTLIVNVSSTYYFTLTNGTTIFRIDLDCPLQPRDVISVNIYTTGSSERGIWLSTSSSRPGSAPSTKITTTTAGDATYTVVADDGIEGESVIYVHRATSNTTYFKDVEITRPKACEAGVPGDIIKGTASGGTGSINLTASGSPASGDTWYWQTSASGTSKTNSTASAYAVSSAGTYHLRSYNTSSDCWNGTTKSVTVAAADLLTAISPTLSYASEVEVGGTINPTLSGNAGSGTVTYALNSVTPAGGLTIDEGTGAVTGVTAGATATVTATITANGNYKGGSATSSTITVADDVCFRMEADASASDELTLSSGESITAGSKNCTTLSGGTAVYRNGASGTMKVQKPSVYGWYFGSNSDSIVITLSGTKLQTGSVITVSCNVGSTSYTLTMNGVTIAQKSGSSGDLLNNEYTVKAGDSGINGKHILVLKRGGGGSVRLYSLSISNCAERETYNVTYYPNGGSGSQATHNVSEVESMSDLGFSRAGYDFTGWKTGASSGTSYAVGDEVTSVLDLYAQWSCVTPTIGTDLSTTQVDYEQDATASALTVAATANGTGGNGTVGYQWYSNTANSTTTPAPTILTGKTSASYTPSTEEVGTTYYFCRVTNTSSGCATTRDSKIAKIVVSEAPCFKFTGGTKNSGWPVAIDGSITTSLYKTSTGAVLTGGTVVNSGTATIGSNDDVKGLVFNAAGNNAITITLSGTHAFAVGTVITISGASGDDNSSSNNFGFSVNGNNLETTSLSTAKKSFEKSYTVAASDGVEGGKTIQIKLNTSCLRKTYLKSVTVTGCAEVTGYTIAFEGNGNTGGSMSDVTEIEEGDDVTLAANGFTKNGYSFANWTADVDVTINSATVDAGDPIADQATIEDVSSDITLTAVWTPNTYDITYNLNGASWAGGYSAPATYTVGTGATLPVAGNMINTGYTFGGWYDNSSLTGSAVTNISTSDYGNKSFWAKWTENTYTVTYSANGGTGDAMSNTVGHYVTLSANTYTKSGYIFAGWNTATDGSGASYSEGEEIELKANLDLYAIWATDYTITWDASPKLSGVDAKPNLGGGNYTITANVATWTGSLTTSMISAETNGVTITSVAFDNSASPKTITATFNVGASVVGDKISFTLDVPANGSFSAKSSTEDFDIDRCTGSSSGSDGVLFSAEFKDSGLGTSDICTAANTAYTFTTAELKAAPTGGSIKAFSTSNLSHMKYATNAISIAGSDGVIRIDLDNPIATNDLFTYLNVNSSSSSAYLRHTSPTTTTDQIALTVYNSKEAKVRLTSGFNGKTTLYIVRNNNDFKLHKAAVVRPAFLMLLRDDAPTSDTNLEGTDAALTTENYLTTIQGGSAYYTSPSSGNLKIKRSNSKNYINFNKAAGYLKIVLNDALQEGDVIGFDSYNTNELAFTSTSTRSTSIRSSGQLYTVDASSDLKGKSTFYIWQNSGSSDYLRGLQIARSGVAGGGGGTDKITTTLTWDTNLSGGVAAETGDADFTHTVTQDKNSLGAITYSSNNTAVATVNASGKVHIVGAGNATITATMAASGCYKEATVSYNITVTDNCADVAGTISTEDLSCSGVRLTVTGHTTSGETVSYQWYKDGGAIGGATSDSYTATIAGEYYVVVTNTGDGHCAKASTNTITLEDSEAATASKIVNSWYVKNGRRTPDIALVQTENATDFTVTSGGSPITTFAGCAFYLGTDGIIYLKGQQEDGSAPTGLTSGDETLKFTATACGGNSSELSITIHKQESTTRQSVAFVVDGTKEGAFDAENEDHSVNTELYQYLDYGADMTGAFDLTGQNVYSTVDEQAIREHYSQFDAILITDDPSTDTKIGKKSCVDAFGTMIDVRPILTMEAFVSKWGNWKAKGIDGNPESPNPRQYKMKLQCKDHAIFKGLSVGTNVETETIDGVEYWTVTMVDNTKSPYSGVADGTDTDTKPALQGFSADDVSSLLLLGEISGGSLYAGVERQEETAARLMLLGLNAKALPNALTPEGKKVIENALKYLIETDLEKVDDCSNYFTGKTSTDWNTDSNWSKGHVPHSPNVRVRILSECVINSGTYKVAEVDIATSGKSINKAGEMTGKLTINAGAALIVGGKIRTAKAPYFNTGDLMPTTEENLVINTSSTAQAALIFNNDAGDTKATVNLYSLGRKDGGHYQFQYYAVPMDYVSVSESFAGSDIYTYVWHEATGWERRGYYTDLYAFEGVGITTKLAAPKTYTMKGALASTATKEITLTKDVDGYNLIGNSWTAPIQISQLEEDNSSLSNKVVYIYNAGNDNTAEAGYGTNAGQWTAIPFNASGFSEWSGMKVIPAMQAFELVPTSEETLTLDYEKVVRGDNQTLTEKLHAPRRVADHAGIELMRIRVADSQTRTDLHLFEGERFSDEFDNGWEAAYKDGDDGTTKLYADVALGHMAVVATDVLEGTLLGFAPGKETEYTFTFGGEGMGYYLNDLKLKTSTLISEGETYSFTYEEGDTNRFYISRTRIDAPQTPTGVENTHSGTVKAHKFIYNDKLYIMLNGRVYSAEGQIVK